VSAPDLDGFLGPVLAEMGVRHGPLDAVQLFTLGFARWAPIFAITPFLGGKLVPNSIRVGLTLLFAIVVLPWQSRLAPLPLDLSAIAWWAILLREVLLGFVVAFAGSLVFWAADMAGQFLDNVRGTTTANLLVPQLQSQSSLLGAFYVQLFVLLYIAAGGHRLFLDAAFRTFDLVPPTQIGLPLALTADAFLLGTGRLFAIALQIVAPALVVLMLLDVILGVANRMAPQLDVFFISLSIKASLGALVAGLALWSLAAYAPELFREHTQWLQQTLSTLGTEGGG
jgi:flagellar biosynthetic protein FliR